MRTQRGPFSTRERQHLKRWGTEPSNRQPLLAIAAAWRNPQLERAAPMPHVDASQTFTLEDGSVMRIAAGSQFKIDLGPTERNIHLTSGEAEFNVAPDRHRPFNVLTPLLRATAVGTRFSVSRHERSWTVSVSEGVVQVRRADDDRRDDADVTIVIANSEFTLFDDSPAASAADTPPTPVWLDLVDVSIGEIIAAFNQRAGSHIQIATPEIAARKMPYGRFRSDSLEVFLDAIEMDGPDGRSWPQQRTHRHVRNGPGRVGNAARDAQ